MGASSRPARCVAAKNSDQDGNGSGVDVRRLLLGRLDRAISELSSDA